jgi:hypothetical protein
LDFAPMMARPTPADEAPAVAELFIGGEGLAHGPANVLGTLLHEAAHGIAVTRAVKDTGRAGAYHNKRFKALGQELGLRIDRHRSQQRLRPPYADRIERLRDAIVRVRESEHHVRHAGAGGQPDDDGSSPGEAGSGGARSAPTYLCGCEPPRWLRMAPTVYALADVLCGACEQPVTVD